MLKLKRQYIHLNKANRLYECPVAVIGLTGGIATGKTTVSNLLKEKKIPLIDADQLVKEIYQFTDTLAFVEQNFSSVITNGKINFKQLRNIVFFDNKKKQQLESYIFSHLPELFHQKLQKQTYTNFVVYDAPLLFEKHLNSLCDINICVYAPKEIQLQRLILRDNIDFELASKMLANQLDIEKKKSMADYIITNSSDLKELSEQVFSLMDKLLHSP